MSYLVKSRQPGNWLPSLLGQKRRKKGKTRRNFAKINQKSKEKFA